MRKIPKVYAIFGMITWVSLSVLRLPNPASAVPDDVTLQSVFDDDRNITLRAPDILQVDSPEADLSLSITDFDPVFASGSSTMFGSYILSVNNAGPDSAENVHIIDMLPGGVAFYGAEGYGWECIEDSPGWVICSASELPVGDAHDITINFTVPHYECTLTNTAWISSDTTTDPDTNNNLDSEQTTVIFHADLSLNLSDSPDIIYPGQLLTYTLEVSNNGASSAENLVVTDYLPGGVTFQAVNGDGWSCDEESGVVTCTRASLAVENAPDITITVIAPSVAGTITNNASIAADTFDYYETNNSDSENATVIPWRTYLPLVAR